MPPKKQEGKPAKVKVDSTFGMKNKKGAVAQKQVKILQQQESQKGKNKETLSKEKERAAILLKKENEKKKKLEESELFTTDIVQPKVPFGVDPKSVLCAFHKAGRCQKGAKCKYSHDLEADRKTQKASIYADQRDESKVEDTMDKWDDEKLLQVVLSKKGNQVTTTDIVCKHFIDAVEGGRYGWFWICPNGDDCKYRHALPQGFVLKSQKKREEEESKRREITLEEFLEVERHKLDHSKLTPLTKESFATWKLNRLSRKEAQAEAEKSAKSASFAMGKSSGMSGRDLFTFNKELLEDSSDEEEDGADGEEEDGDWDLDRMREKTEEDRKAAEEERIRKLGGNVENLSLHDRPPE